MSKSATIVGLIWSCIDKFAAQGIQFITSILIARLVLPSDYGLVAMITIFIGIGQTFIDSGFSNALIHKKDRNQVDYSTVFYFNVFISVLFFLLLYFCAIPISRFYGLKELIPITRISSFTIVLNAFAIVQKAKLTIDINFKDQAKCSIISSLLGGIIGVYIAYLGYGVWALIAVSLCYSGFNSFLLWLIVGWRPSLVFSRQSFRSLFSYGSNLLITGILHTIYTNLYSLIIGKLYRPKALGFYNRASSLGSFIPFSMTEVMYRVAYPVQCKIQDNTDDLLILFNKYIVASAYVIYPLCIIMSIFSKDIIHVILGEKWESSAGLLSILSIGFMLRPTICLNETLLTVVGRTDVFLRMVIVKRIIGLIVLITTLYFDLYIIAMGLSVYYIIDLVVSIIYAKKFIPTSISCQVKLILPVVSICLISTIFALIVSIIIDNSLFAVITGGIVFLVSYLLLSILFNINCLSVIINVFRPTINRDDSE